MLLPTAFTTVGYYQLCLLQNKVCYCQLCLLQIKHGIANCVYYQIKYGITNYVYNKIKYVITNCLLQSKVCYIKLYHTSSRIPLYDHLNLWAEFLIWSEAGFSGTEIPSILYFSAVLLLCKLILALVQNILWS